MDGISTHQLVEQLRRDGWRVSPQSLRLDVHRGLISPLMPSTETSGRGVPARWSRMSVVRARRMARLRARDVNGHVLPLLLFLEDGWGWERILPDLQAAARKAWELDRAHLSTPNRVKIPDDLLDNADDADAWLDDPRHEAIRSWRRWLFGQQWYGKTIGNASPLPLMVAIAPAVLGVEASAEQREQSIAAGTAAARRREVLGLPASGVADRLATLDAEAVERGRQLFWLVVRILRHQSRSAGATASTNPLTLGGESPKELAAYLRSSSGRLTLAHVLGAVIAQVMLMAELTRGMGLLPDSS